MAPNIYLQMYCLCLASCRLFLFFWPPYFMQPTPVIKSINDFQTFNILMNRSLKPSSLLKRKITNLQLSPSVFRCVGLPEPLGLKINKIQQILGSESQLPEPAYLNKDEEEEDAPVDVAPDNSEEKCVESQNTILKHRKNIYRSRKDKKSSLSKPKLAPKTKIMENSRLLIFFRSQIITLFSALGKRQQFINSLRGNRISVTVPPLKAFQIEQRLQKQLDNKGKDKTRKTFNHLTNEQLRSLKYKPKPIPVSKKEPKSKGADMDQQDEQDAGNAEEDDEQDCPDMQTWKRRNSVGFNQRVFIIKGGYHELRRTLLEKGWAENEDVRSQFFDFKWTTRICDINYSGLKNGQMVNHFNNNHHLTSKYGITRRLRTLPISHNVDIDRFYPRCFDLGDQNQFENFVEDFKFCFAESICKRFLVDKQRYKGLQLKVRTTLKVIRKQTLSLAEKINKINNGQFPVIDAAEWEILTETDDSPSQLQLQKLQQLRQSDLTYVDGLDQQQYFQSLHHQIQGELRRLEQQNPQDNLNGLRNVWIAKPNFLSRGRGIRCFNNLYEIADYCLGRDVQFVIQKYIERPLLVHGRKFDIRQWVLIQDYAPPRIYFYEECYLRFSMDDFSLDNIKDRFIHLTNNSVQKHNKKAKINESMWYMSEFAQHIGAQKWEAVQQKIKNIVVWSIKSCQNYVTAKKGSCELVGFDFMIDQQLNPWLIEINMSPAMDSSTPVTAKLVKMLLHDTGLLLSSAKVKKKVGNYTCIYEGDADLANFTHYVSKE